MAFWVLGGRKLWKHRIWSTYVWNMVYTLECYRQMREQDMCDVGCQPCFISVLLITLANIWTVVNSSYKWVVMYCVPCSLCAGIKQINRNSKHMQFAYLPPMPGLDSGWNVMAHSDAREGKWRGNWRMEWVASTLHTTSELGVSNITTADAHTSAASSRLNWRHRRFKWTCTFTISKEVDSSWNVMAHSDIQKGKWSGNWRMDWVASTLHTTSEHGVSGITTADAHTSAASSRLNWRPPADLNGLVRFAKRWNLVSAREPSHFKCSLRILPFDTNIYEHVSDLCAPYPLSPHFWLKEIFTMTYVVTATHHVLCTWPLAFIAIQECQYFGCYCKQ